MSRHSSCDPLDELGIAPPPQRLKTVLAQNILWLPSADAPPPSLQLAKYQPDPPQTEQAGLRPWS